MILIKNAYDPHSNQVINLLLADKEVKVIAHDEISTYKKLIQKADQIIDADKRIVINCFVDKHTHLDKSNLTSISKNQSGSLKEAIEKTQKIKIDLSEETIYSNAKKTLDKMLANGIGCVRTHVDVDKFAKLKGLKAILRLKEEYKDRVNIQIVSFPQEGFISDKENYKYFLESMEYDIDYVGGIPLNDSNPQAHIEMVFKMAKEFDLGVDMHIDESDDPKDKSVMDVIESRKKYPEVKEVYVGHLCSLITQAKDTRAKVIEDLISNDIKVISLPSTNLYLQGRNDQVSIRRGIAPVKEFYEKGLEFYIGSDNFRDLFNPFGNGNMLEEVLIAAHACHMGSPNELSKLFQVVSVGILDTENLDYLPANLLIIDSQNSPEAIINQSDIYKHISY